MSRMQVAKSRAEKNAKPSAPTPAVTHEIVPKFTNNDWASMLEHDDSDDFIFGIVEEVCSNSKDIIFKNYIDRQLIPFTVSQAKDALLQIIEWQFLSRDEGEVVAAQPVVDAQDIIVQDMDEWAEDEEPCISQPDCWAQGSVPKHYVIPPTPSIVEEIEPEQIEAEEEIKAEGAEETTGGSIAEESTGEEGLQEGSLPAEESIVEEEGQEEPEDTGVKLAESEIKELPAQAKTKRKYKPRKGKLGSAGVSRLTESLESTEMKRRAEQQHQASQDKTLDPDRVIMPLSCQSLLRLQAGRPPGSREVEYDEKGNVINMVKIDPEALPIHYVRTKYTVVDPAVEAAQAHLTAMRTGKFVGGARKKAMMASPRLPRSTSKAVTSTGKTGSSLGSHDKGNISPLPPPLMESMDVMPGVVVREGGRVKAGPRLITKRDASSIKTSTKILRPVTFRAMMPAVAVADLLDRGTPIIKPKKKKVPTATLR